MDFAADAPMYRVISTLENLGFQVVKSGSYLSLQRMKTDGTRNLITIPNRQSLRGSTLRVLCSQTGVPIKVFLELYRFSG
jgi:predicted RNA binding protein YcfA (HicA-like mRNA interferase family)